MGLKVGAFSYFTPIEGVYDGGAQRLFGGLISGLEDDQRVDTIDIIGPPAGRRAPRNGPPQTTNHYLQDPVDALPSSPVAARADRTLTLRVACECDAMVSIDRVFPVASPTPLILCLNNLSYGPETAAAFAPGWDAIVVPSATLRQELVDHGLGPDAWHGGNSPTIHVIPPGLDYVPPPRARRVHSAIRLCFPHRPDPGKDFSTAVEVVRTLTDRGHSVTLHVPEPHADALWPEQRVHLRERRDLVHRLGIADLVTFHDWIAAADISRYLSQFDVCLALSLLPESFGLTVIESLSVGTPVIATRTSAYRELGDLGAVIFVDESSPQQVCDAIIALPSPSECADAAARTRQRFSWASATAQWVTLLQSVTRAHGYRTYETVHYSRPRTPPTSEG